MNHLVDCAIALRQELVGKPKGDVINGFGFLVGQKRLVVAPRWNHASVVTGTQLFWLSQRFCWFLVVGMGFLGRMTYITPLIPILPIACLSHSSPRIVFSASSDAEQTSTRCNSTETVCPNPSLERWDDASSREISMRTWVATGQRFKPSRHEKTLENTCS